MMDILERSLAKSKHPCGLCSRSEMVQEQRLRIRARHETVNARFENFGFRTQTFRHPLVSHGSAVRAVAVLVLLALENGEPLFHL